MKKNKFLALSLILSSFLSTLISNCVSIAVIKEKNIPQYKIFKSVQKDPKQQKKLNCLKLSSNRRKICFLNFNIALINLIFRIYFQKFSGPKTLPHHHIKVLDATIEEKNSADEKQLSLNPSSSNKKIADERVKKNRKRPDATTTGNSPQNPSPSPFSNLPPNPPLSPFPNPSSNPSSSSFSNPTEKPLNPSSSNEKIADERVKKNRKRPDATTTGNSPQNPSPSSFSNSPLNPPLSPFPNSSPNPSPSPFSNLPPNPPLSPFPNSSPNSSLNPFSNPPPNLSPSSSLGDTAANKLTAKLQIKYESLEEIASGQYGTIYKAKTINSDMLVCLKESEHKYIKNLEKEYSIIHDLDHPCIIKGSKIFNKDQYDYIEMEFIDGKDLFDFIYNEDHLLDEQTIIYIFVQLAGAVKYCHKNNILHRDLKLENIMIMSDEKYKIKVIDFGISKIFKKEIFSTKKQIGTPGCMAPEIILRLLYSFPADIWALGCILYQMVAHREPFAGDNVDKVLVKTVQEEPPPILEGNFSEELKKLIFSMLVKNPQLRISLDEIFQLPIIQNTISEYPKLKEYIQN